MQALHANAVTRAPLAKAAIVGDVVADNAAINIAAIKIFFILRLTSFKVNRPDTDKP